MKRQVRRGARPVQLTLFVVLAASPAAVAQASPEFREADPVSICETAIPAVFQDNPDQSAVETTDDDNDQNVRLTTSSQVIVFDQIQCESRVQAFGSEDVLSRAPKNSPPMHAFRVH